jgi:hypothetical protein
VENPTFKNEKIELLVCINEILGELVFKYGISGNHNESSPIPNSVETVIPKRSKPCVTLQAICERCVYFAVQRIFPRRGSMTRSHPQPSPFGSVHVLQLGTIKQGFLLNISVKILDLTLVLIWPLPESIIVLPEVSPYCRS